MAGQYPPHREYVGKPEAFDLLGGRHFVLLYLLGLREHHCVLDVGCGSLRSGRLLIQYLAPGRYYGLVRSIQPLVCESRAPLT